MHYDDGVDKVHSLHNTKVRTVIPSEAETGVEEISVAAGTSGSSAGTQLDMPPSWPNSPVNTPRPQPDPPSQPPSNGTAPAAAAPSPPSQQLDMPPSWPNSPVNTPRPQPDPPSQPPSNGTAPAAPSSPLSRPDTPQTMNNEGQPAAPDLPSFLPAHLKVINEGGVTPSFIHHGEKVTAFPDAVAAPNSNTEDIEYEAALESYEAFNPLSAAMVKDSINLGDFGVPANSIQQAKSGDIGLSKIIAATLECQANISSRASILGSIPF